MSDTLTIEAIKEMRRLISLEGGHDPYTLQVFDLAIAQHAEIEKLRAANRDSKAWFAEVLARAEKAEAEVERMRPLVVVAITVCDLGVLSDDMMDTVEAYEKAKILQLEVRDKDLDSWGPSS